jgi:hypothetical protein
MVWKGVIIEESLEDRGILNLVRVVRKRKDILEGEEEKGIMHLHYFELDDRRKAGFVATAKHSLKRGWYIHICKGGVMVVIFRGRSFEFTRRQKEVISLAREHGKHMGILEGQMDFEDMIDKPWG